MSAKDLVMSAAGSSGPATYIEDVFSTYLYTSNYPAVAQTITNGIDLAGKGGLVWMKCRSHNTGPHVLVDTNRGAQKYLSISSGSEISDSQSLTSFNNTGFSIGTQTAINAGYGSYVSWTFRKQTKFFDIVTYTGNQTSRNISHNLGTVPGAIFIHAIDRSGDQWGVYHKDTGIQKYLALNQTWSVSSASDWMPTTPTSETFPLSSTNMNSTGTTYVAYLFAHNAGGFGPNGTDNVISCGSFTTDGSGNIPSTTLGYEPQWMLVKPTTTTGNWVLLDNMRGLALSTSGQSILYANTSGGEGTASTSMYINATGFSSGAWWAASQTYIYIAIRRGPMKVPTVGTSVFSPIAYVGANGAAQNITAGFPVDMDIIKIRNDGTRDPLTHNRLMGGVFLKTDAADAEASFSDNIVSFNNAQNVIGLPATGGGTNEINGASTSTYIAWSFRRAPSFFDQVCYTGTGSATTFNHNLGVVPELMIFKKRSATTFWRVWQTSGTASKSVYLNSTAAWDTDTRILNDTLPTSSVFTVGTSGDTNTSGATYVAYLFATLAGVSKVGSYTGTGTTLQVNCGFTGGARFVLIKRTDSTGDWYVWDLARGINAANDPHLSLNTTAAEVTTDDSIDPDSTGFIVNQVAATNINVTSATYIYLAIA